jgi:hypothetical protein
MYKFTVYVTCVGRRKIGKSRQKVARTEGRSFDLEQLWPKAYALPAELRPVGLAARLPRKDHLYTRTPSLTTSLAIRIASDVVT